MAAEWRRKRERRRHFKEKMSLEEAHHHRRPWIRAWRKKMKGEGEKSTKFCALNEL